MVHVLKSAGAERASAITKRTIQAGIDRRAATPFQAKNFLTTMREFFKWAVSAGHLNSNPTDGIRVKKPKSDGFPVWTEGDIVAFEKRWPLGTRERVLFDIYCYTGLRRGDAAALGPKHVTNGVITIKTEKTGMEVSFPVLPALARSLKAGPVGAETFIATLQGKSMTKESVGNFFHDACKTAGIQKSAHGLRKAAATRAADEGATEAELDAVFGWTGGRMAALYTRSANRRRLAKNAMSKLDRAPSPAQGVGENINNNNSLDENWCARED
jgi:integrase